jgi:hypothetical protein
MAISPNASKVITGGRTVVSLNNGSGPVVIGIFDSCSINESLTTEDIHILGRFGAAEITLTAYNSVNVTCTGFRVYGAGVKILGQFPTLNALLGLGPISLSVTDRENPNGAPLATVVGCIPNTNSNNFQSRATSKINISYVGTMITDESAPNDAESGAVGLP